MAKKFVHMNQYLCPLTSISLEIICTLWYCRHALRKNKLLLKQLQVQVHVVPVEKGGGAGVEGGGSGDANDGEEPPRKRAKVMLLQVMRKGMQVIVN